MKLKILLFLAILPITVAAWAEPVWIKATLIDRPHIDPTTKIDVRGKDYPDVVGLTMIEKYEIGLDYLICIDETADKIQEVLGQKSFNPVIIPDPEVICFWTGLILICE